jgi:hypothetical protein
MSNSDARSWSWAAIGFLLLVNLIAVSFFFSPGTGDVSIWETWMREISAYGIIGGFKHTGTDYPPLAFIFLGAVVRIAESFGTAYLLVLQCSLLVFLLATAVSFYWFTRDLLLTAVLELSLVLNSIALGYLDIYFAPFLIAAFFLLQRKHLTIGFLFYAISCAIKWQPLILAPFVCVYVLSAAKERASGAPRIKNQIAHLALSVLILVVPICALFGLPAIFDSFKRALTYHKLLSGDALNLGWIQTWALHLLNPDKYGGLLQDGIIDVVIVRDPFIVWPNKILFYLSYVAIFVAFARQTKTFQRLIVYSMLGYLAYFCFNTGVHENHLFLICCLAWILVFFEPGQIVRCINLTLAANANLFLFFGAFGHRLNPVIAGIDITLLFVPVNLCLFAGFLWHTFKMDGLTWRFWRAAAA